ncbi:acyltransferase family protein [Solicola sp. PLA-1-18]|uniref:acyltransferase family protein n=1 Tax=Solicola sp. PLA-1-18 TaxID=3380532 RepID=UPI003B77A6E4
MTDARPVYPGLDTLRAIAALAVVVTHVGFQTGFYGSGALGAAVAHLDLGVAVFFVLSGFLLTRPYLVAAHGGRPADRAGRFYVKRALRIVPVYAVSVVAALVLLDQPRPVTPELLLRHATFTQVYSAEGLPAGLTQMWSLATEVAFYVLLPVLCWLATRPLARRLPRVPLACAMAVGVSVAWNAGLGSVVGGQAQPNLWLPAFAGWFAVGIALAWVTVVPSAKSRPWVATVLVAARRPGACWLLALAIFVVVCTPVGGPLGLILADPSQAVARNLAYTAISGLVVLPAVLGPTTGVYARAFALPVLRHLGHISYSVFCCHLIVLDLAFELMGTEPFRGGFWAVLAVTVLLSVAVSEVLYRVVERPALRLKDVGRRHSTAEASTPRQDAATS